MSKPLTKDQLLARVRKHNIRGYSSLRKKELENLVSRKLGYSRPQQEVKKSKPVKEPKKYKERPKLGDEPHTSTSSRRRAV